MCIRLSPRELGLVIEAIQNPAIVGEEREKYEKLFLRCVPDPEALDFILKPETQALALDDIIEQSLSFRKTV